ncbi:TauD/TfdA dioxygenase family protein [Novosphingobium bradum]|uniref:TauD/TfdA dioxygenase family protein n=1 Tax=Novosphingobium bradum TaxID=1737444 RepID=A0ABV7IQM6_9SPHN
MPGYRITPLADGLGFGATVSGLTLAQLQDEGVRRAIHDLWIDKGVVLFRDGEDSPAMQSAVSACFGQNQQHLFPEVRVEGNPDLVTVKYWRGNGTIVEIDGKAIGGWLPWHSDLAYSARINRGGVLRPIELPARGGGKTGFIDQIAAWDRLPAALQARIDGLHAVYVMDLNPEHMRFGRPAQVRLIEEAPSFHGIQQREWEFPRILHPMVYEQRETGRKVLNVSPWFCAGIYELGGREGEALMHEVVAHCTDPALAYYHDWQPGDMVAWDNWRTLHSATGVDPDDRRLMHRTTIFGDYALGRVLEHHQSATFDV